VILRKRFSKNLSEAACKYASSIDFDKRLYTYDIAGSIAHTRMLAKQGIIPPEDAEKIISGLTSIRKEIEQEKFSFKEELEDIHINIEARLTEMIGDVAGKLHTARSRNDQIALDMRLFTREVITNTIHDITQCQQAIITLAEKNKEMIIPGYTHLQRAQPILLAHHLLAYYEMLKRDKERFQDCFKRVDFLPLGSGALAGVPYPIDRESVAHELGFTSITDNSIDAVSDRDFVIEYEAAASLTMLHLSRLAEEFVIWSSVEFSFIEIDDAYTTSSSIMPQKKNPDIAELMRGKTGRVYGHLIGLLTIMKGLPLSYNRDMQEDKEGFFDTVDTLLSTLEVASGMITTTTVNTNRIQNTINEGYLLATDIADYLVKKGLPFREAHSIVSKIVRYAIEQNLSLKQISLSDYQEFCLLFQNDVYAITPEYSLNTRNIIGGTAPEQVDRALTKAKKEIINAGRKQE